MPNPFMKQLLLITLLTFSAFPVVAQDWLTGSSGNFVSEALDVTTDPTGNSILTGYFSGQIQFNDSTETAVSGLNDILLAKFDPNGNMLWLQRFGGNQADRGHKVVTDASGNIYVTGYFAGSMTMGSFTLNSNGGSRDIFLAKLNPAGVVLWARSDGGSSEETPYGLAVDTQGSPVITGRFEGTSTIGGTTYTSQFNPFAGAPGFDIFIAKFTTAGTPVWTKKGNSRQDDTGLAVVCDNSNNVYVTGQYSDTMTFITQTINNQVNNAGYVAKLSSNGDFVWFDKLGATQTYANAIRINSSNELYVTGNFLGTMNILANSVNTQLTNPYIKKIFLIKIGAANGNYIWGRAQGSDSDVNARGLTLDNSENVFICGDFRCNFDEYRDSTDTGLWNTVGFRDIFVSKFSPGGGMIWNKHSGGKKEDLCYALANGGNDKPIFAGSFENDLFIPTNTYNLTNISFSPDNIVFNGAPGAAVSFLVYRILGDLSKNVFVGKVNDMTNPNYYYYLPGMGGGVPFDYIEPDLYPQQDSVEFCNAMYLFYQQHADPIVGPDYDFAWSADNLDENPFLYVAHTNEWVTVTSTSIDGCTTFQDSIYTTAHSSPPLPLMSDDHGFNSNSPVSYTNIQLCLPDTALVSFQNLCNQCSLQINYYNTPFHSGIDTFSVYTPGDYSVIVTDENGCTSQSVFAVIHDSIIDYDSIYPVILMIDADNFDDSISICENETIQFIVIDTITNPNGDYVIYSEPFIDEAFFSPDIIPNPNSGPHSCTIVPDSTGWYTLNYMAHVGYENACGVDTIEYLVTDSFYIYVAPLPDAPITMISDSPICPGDSCYISISDTIAGGIWTGGNNIIWQSTDNDSILVSQIGFYSYAGALTDSISGCTTDFTTGVFVTNKIAPLIQMYPYDGLICPNGSVTLSVVPPGTYQWIAPDGSLLGTDQSLEVTEAGLYSCIYTDPDSCMFTLEQVEITEYIIPFIAYSPVNIFCEPGLEIELIPVYNGSAAINWLAPINSNENTVTVTEPGTYYCEIYQCNTNILDSVIIYEDLYTPFIQATDTLLCPNVPITLTTNPGMISYDWNDGEFQENPLTVTEPGTYEVTMVSALGCEKSISINIGAHVIPPVPDVADTTVCEGEDVTLVENSAFSTAWYGNPSDAQPLATGTTYTINNIPSTTTIYVTHPHPACPFLFDTVVVTVNEALLPPDIYGDATLCEGEQLELSTDNLPGVTPVWFFNNDSLTTGTSLSLPYSAFASDGTIFLQISSSCFSVSTSVPLNLVPDYTLELNAENTTACDYNTITLYPVPSFSGELFWINGNDTLIGNPLMVHNFDVSDSTFTLYGIDNDGCITLPVNAWVHFVDCTPVVPNVITSDNDGINDYFLIPNAELMDNNYLIILNRWGNVIYETENYQNNFNGSEFSEGVYFYRFYPDGKDGVRPPLDGFFHLYH